VVDRDVDGGVLEKSRGSRRSRAQGELRQAHCDKSATSQLPNGARQDRADCERAMLERVFARRLSVAHQADEGKAVPTAGGQKEQPTSQAGGWIRGRSQVSGLGAVDIAGERETKRSVVRLVHNDGRLRKLDETASEQGSGRFAGKAKQRREQRASESEKRKAKRENRRREREGRDGRECRETGRQEERSRGDEEATSRRG
jgi:hypothetical protein